MGEILEQSGNEIKQKIGEMAVRFIKETGYSAAATEDYSIVVGENKKEGKTVFVYIEIEKNRVRIMIPLGRCPPTYFGVLSEQLTRFNEAADPGFFQLIRKSKEVCYRCVIPFQNGELDEGLFRSMAQLSMDEAFSHALEIKNMMEGNIPIPGQDSLVSPEQSLKRKTIDVLESMGIHCSVLNANICDMFVLKTVCQWNRVTLPLNCGVNYAKKEISIYIKIKWIRKKYYTGLPAYIYELNKFSGPGQFLIHPKRMLGYEYVISFSENGFDEEVFRDGVKRCLDMVSLRWPVMARVISENIKSEKNEKPGAWDSFPFQIAEAVRAQGWKFEANDDCSHIMVKIRGDRTILTAWIQINAEKNMVEIQIPCGEYCLPLMPVICDRIAVCNAEKAYPGFFRILPNKREVQYYCAVSYENQMFCSTIFVDLLRQCVESVENPKRYIFKGQHIYEGRSHNFMKIQCDVQEKNYWLGKMKLLADLLLNERGWCGEL